jgi:hypothetical protein
MARKDKRASSRPPGSGKPKLEEAAVRREV